MGCHGDGIGRRLLDLPDGALQPVSWHQGIPGMAACTRSVPLGSRWQWLPRAL